MQRGTWGAEGSWDAGCLRAQFGFLMGVGALGEVRGLNYGYAVDAGGGLWSGVGGLMGELR